MSNNDHTSRLQAELNEHYERQGRYLAAWLAAFPGSDVVSAPEPEELVQRFRARLDLQHENERLRESLARRQALLEKDSVQAALWISSWPVFRWPLLRGLLKGMARRGRFWFGKQGSSTAG